MSRVTDTITNNMSEGINFKKVEDGELLKWETPGAKLLGVLKSYKSQRTAMGDGHVYEVQTKDALVPFFAPSLLHKKLKDVSVGNIVQIEYIKKTKTAAGTDLKHFEVQFAKPTEANLKAAGIEIFETVSDSIDPDDINI